MGTKLPSPQQIRNQFGYGNESYDFFNILNAEIRGRHYGHVFSFGDNDTPDYVSFDRDPHYSLTGTKVEHVHHYHTGIAGWWGNDNKWRTGYAKWCHMLPDSPLVEFDQTWCKVIRN